MSPAARAALRALVIAGGVAVAALGLLAVRIDDWPIYLAYTLVAIVLYPPYVEVTPRLTLPIPGLAATIGFLYIAGLPVILLQSVAFTASVIVRRLLPARWRSGVQTLFGVEESSGRAVPTKGTVADWATFGLGLAVRWWIASALVPGARPASHPAAIAVAELGGEGMWALLSVLPIYSFRSPLASARERGRRVLMQDLALVILFTLTPFVFLITYGYEAHGLAGAVFWSFAALGLHFVLKRLNERRVGLEEQNRRLEALNRELEHRERLSAIGKMSSVVSHQMLQQLGLIGIHVDLIRHAVAGDDATGAVAQATESAAAIEEALGGVNRVLRDLLVFSRDLRVNVYEHALVTMLGECVEECAPQARSRGVTLRVACTPESSATFDKLKVKQALANVVRNAVDASPSGAEVFVQAEVRDGWVEIRVTDRGPGVPDRDCERVFTPFFTTKEEGTGLGLAIARAFVEAHGGRIAIEHPEGGGARFVLCLPHRGPPSGH